jgi:hypothetical protein
VEQSFDRAGLNLMELYFNEISGNYPEKDLYHARERMKGFLQVCKAARQKGFQGIRTDREFDAIKLCEGYKVWDWYQDERISKVFKDFFLGFRKFPFEPPDDDTAEDRFITADYRLDEPDEKMYHGALVGGLAWAYIMQTLAISFPVHSVWLCTQICLREEKGRKSAVVMVKHASQGKHIEIHNEWIVSLQAPVLLKTDMDLAGKKISLRDDHGKEVLKEVAARLIRSPYVTEVINSLPFNPNARSFVKRIYPDGRIEVVLIWTDQGLGMVVQTTGRNLRETQAIAGILEETCI